jgi:ATP-dependent protease HslVU (ClpYQ) peptidase subunit
LTCILGYLSNEGVLYMAADGRCTGSSAIYCDTQQKITQCGEWLVGATGESLLTSLVIENSEYLGDLKTAFSVSQGIRKILKDTDWTTSHEESGSLRYGVSLMIGRAGELWTALSNLGVVPVMKCSFMGVGSGSDFAIGAADALRRELPAMPMKDVIQRAMTTAARFDSAVGGTATLYVVDYLQGGAVIRTEFDID